MKQKVVLITGATGMAAASARLAAAEGARVFVASLVEADCRALAEETGAAWHAGDLADAAVADAAVARCLAHYGRIDGLFNVAGISGRRFGDAPLHECTEQGWDTTMAVNARSLFLVSRAVLRHMLERPADSPGGRGAILNMASVVVLSPEPKHFAAHAYAASKGAIIALTRAMASYYAPHGIRVNALAPGLVRTPMSVRAQGDRSILEYMPVKQPLAPGMIEPEDIARAAVFLLSDDARTITGEILSVDGGWSVTAS